MYDRLAPPSVCEFSAYQDLPIRLNCQGVNIASRPGIKTQIRCAICIKAPDEIARLGAKSCKVPTHENIKITPAIILDGKRLNRAICSGIERCIQRAVRIQAADVRPRHPA